MDRVTEDFASPDWNIYFANSLISVIKGVSREILREEGARDKAPRAASTTLENKLMS